VFLVLPPAFLAEYGRFLRLFVLAALSEMTKHDLNSRPFLFMLDEFFSLG
jgi:type IV secretory pathway TraG/TraD family ATPase VirD4